MMPELIQLALMPAISMTGLAVPAAVYVFSRNPARRRRALRVLSLLIRR